MIVKIISGGQVGADISSLQAAYDCGIKTGGTMPKGFKTQIGPKPNWAKKFGLEEHSSDKYPPRTYKNVKDSDATLRFAKNFNSSGELCTMKAINQYKKPYLDIDINNLPPEKEIVDWLISNNIQILNIAGNAESTSKGIGLKVYKYLVKVFTSYLNELSPNQ